jgi:hypothetical protein
VSSLYEEAEVEPLPAVYPLRPGTQLHRLEEALRRLMAVVERRTTLLSNTLDEARAVFLAVRDRVELLEGAAVSLSIVDTVADLPAEASARQLYRVASGTLAERASLYVGNGPGRPLTKVVPTAI